MHALVLFLFIIAAAVTTVCCCWCCCWCYFPPFHSYWPLLLGSDTIICCCCKLILLSLLAHYTLQLPLQSLLLTTLQPGLKISCFLTPEKDFRKIEKIWKWRSAWNTITQLYRPNSSLLYELIKHNSGCYISFIGLKEVIINNSWLQASKYGKSLLCLLWMPANMTDILINITGYFMPGWQCFSASFIIYWKWWW